MNPGAVVTFFYASFSLHWQPRNQRKTLQLVLKMKSSFAKTDKCHFGEKLD